MRFLDREGFSRLLSLLAGRGYRVIGPRVRDGAIVLDHVERVEDFPRGIRESQVPGGYALEPTGDGRLFAWAHGPDSARRFLSPPREEIRTALRRDDGSIEPHAARLPDVRFAFVGLRACDLAAIEIQDRVFLIAEPSYRSRRGNAIFIGVNCEFPGSTCFCASMGTGPRCTRGFDVALTELEDGFTAVIGTPLGAELLDALHASAADEGQIQASHEATHRAREAMGKQLDTSDLPGLLYRNRKHARWNDVASRCLACTNCTMVCPTCFCHDAVETVSLDGRHATRERQWASCFSEEFTHLASGSVRVSVESRYRQWLTHKFASWIDQFGTSGCVGCGRCITWCPVGIDVTEEIAAIRAADGEVRLAEEVSA